MFQIKYLNVVLLILSGLGISTAQAATLQALTDEQLSEMTGLALMSLSYTSPTDASNLESKRDGGAKNIGFYKLGLEADLELNVNIKKLQLGCGGVNNSVRSGVCDIDIDNISLSGLGNSASSNTGSDSDRAARVGSSAVLTNPFIQFAIKNPDSASTREVVGINLSSEKAMGLITFGWEHSDTPNGINTLSGFMTVAATSGLAKVNGFGTSLVSGEAAKGALTQSYTGVAIKGKASGVNFTTKSYNLNLRDSATGSNVLNGILNLPQQDITGKRISSAILKANATVNDIAISGNIVANALLIINLDRETTGTIKNLKVDATIDEGLNFFHKASLNGTPASLSLQSQDLQWTANKSVAARGWWLEFSNPIDIGDITPSKAVNIELPTLVETLGQINTFLAKPANEINCGSWGILSCLFGSSIPVGTVDLTNAPAASMPLKDLVLKKQDFTPNCYGSLKFC